MSALTRFLEWLYDILKRGVSFVASVPGMILAGVSTVAGVVGSMFSNFTWWSSPTQWLQNATSSVSNFVNGDFGMIGEYVIRFCAIDSLVSVLIVLVGATVGVTIAIFVTVFVATVSTIPVVLGIKAILKAVRVASVGFLDP